MLNIGAHLIEATAFILLGGITGAVMNVITTIRDVFFVIDEKRSVKNDKITKRDWEILSVFIILILFIFLIDFLIVLLYNSSNDFDSIFVLN